MNPYPTLIRWGAGLLLLGILLAGLAKCSYDKGAARNEAKHTAAQLESERVARAVENAWAGAIYNFAYEAETARLQRESETTARIACLRDGTCRLRDRFVCPKLPQAAGAATVADDRTQYGFQLADVEFLIRFAATCGDVLAERNLGKDYAETVTAP